MKVPFVLALCLLTLLPNGAAAEPRRAPARAAYARGKAAYEQGAYGEALRHFEEAYRTQPAPALLFNMAQAHRLSGPEHCEQALELYRKYLVEDPKASNREEAAERVGEMAACVERQRVEAAQQRAASEQPAEAPRPSPPVTPERAPAAMVRREPLADAHDSRDEQRPRSPTAAIVLTGAGATLGVVGAIVYLRSRAKYAEVEDSCPCEPGAFSNWETLTNVSYAMMAAGLLGTTAGVSWLLLGGDDADPHRVSGVLVRGVAHF